MKQYKYQKIKDQIKIEKINLYIKINYYINNKETTVTYI